MDLFSSWTSLTRSSTNTKSPGPAWKLKTRKLPALTSRQYTSTGHCWNHTTPVWWVIPTLLSRDLSIEKNSCIKTIWKAFDVESFIVLTLACCIMACIWASCAETAGPFCPASPPALNRNCRNEGQSVIQVHNSARKRPQAVPHAVFCCF